MLPTMIKQTTSHKCEFTLRTAFMKSSSITYSLSDLELQENYQTERLSE